MGQSVDAHCIENSTDEQCACMKAAEAFDDLVKDYSEANTRKSEIDVKLNELEEKYDKTDGLLKKYDEKWDQLKRMDKRQEKLTCSKEITNLSKQSTCLTNNGKSSRTTCFFNNNTNMSKHI